MLRSCIQHLSREKSTTAPVIPSMTSANLEKCHDPISLYYRVCLLQSHETLTSPPETLKSPRETLPGLPTAVSCCSVFTLGAPGKSLSWPRLLRFTSSALWTPFHNCRFISSRALFHGTGSRSVFQNQIARPTNDRTKKLATQALLKCSLIKIAWGHYTNGKLEKACLSFTCLISLDRTPYARMRVSALGTDSELLLDIRLSRTMEFAIMLPSVISGINGFPSMTVASNTSPNGTQLRIVFQR
jgi:hypothetical protein